MPVLRQIQGETAVESFTGFARISTKNMSETGFFHLRDGNPHIYCAGYEIINALILFVRIMCHIVTGIVFLSHRAQSVLLCRRFTCKTIRSYVRQAGYKFWV